METMTMYPFSTANSSAWQLSLSALGCATSALATLQVQGIAMRPATIPTVFAPFALVATDAAPRKRAITAKAVRGSDAAHVPGLPAWSPPI